MENLTFTFGKFKDRTIHDVFKEDKGYIMWIIKQKWFKDKFIKHYQCCLILLKPVDSINENDIIIYTDGACSKNGSTSAKAGIGIYFSKRNKIKFDDVSEPLLAYDENKVTNQRAELYAILKALRITKEVINHIIIYTDSEYSINCVMRWFAFWVSKNIVDKKKNVDLIRPIHQYYRENNFEFRHINSHTGLQDEHSLGNEEADRLATNGMNIKSS